MKHFAIFDIRLCQLQTPSRRRGPDPSLYGVNPDMWRVANGVLPSAGATLCHSNFLLR